MKALFNIEKVKELTREARERRQRPEDSVVARIQKAFDRAELGCVEPHVHAIINALLEGMGKEGIVRNKKIEYSVGTMVVPRDNHNSHDYPLGEPVLITDQEERYGIAIDGTVKNHLPDNFEGMRYATDEEIDRWFNC